MNKFYRFTKLILLIILVGLLSLLNLASAQRLTVGEAALDFTLLNATGEVITLEDLKGTPVVLNFWATWCVPCREELPLFQSVYDEVNSLSVNGLSDAMSSEEDMPEDMPETIAAPTESAKKLHFVIINNNEDAEKAQNFLDEINITMTSLVEATKEQRSELEAQDITLDKTLDVVKRYRVRGMPTTFYIDAEGNLQSIKQGLISNATMQADLEKIGIAWEPTTSTE